MLEQALRGYYQKNFVDPFAYVIQHEIQANTMTYLSGVIGLLVLPALYCNQVALAIIFLLLSGYCDTLDGTLARLNQTSSHWGSILDIMIDRVVELSVVLALFIVAPESRGFWSILMLGSILLCMTSFLVVGIFTENYTEKSFHYSPGLMERAEAFLFFIAMMIWPSAFSYLAALFTLLVIYTAVVRLYEFKTL